MNILFKKLNIFPNKLKAGGGFTMIELLVTVSIFAVITSVMLANYPKFSSKIVLDNVAYQVAISIRQAQTYGLSVKEFGIGVGATFPGYGIYFPSPGNDKKSFTVFADINGDKKYNSIGCGANGSECLEKFTMQGFEYIYALCGNLKSDDVKKFNTIGDVDKAINNCGNINSLHISFTRPDPDATITAHLGGNEYETYPDAEIVIANLRGNVRTIVVWTTGQIFVE